MSTFYKVGQLFKENISSEVFRIHDIIVGPVTQTVYYILDYRDIGRTFQVTETDFCAKVAFDCFIPISDSEAQQEIFGCSHKWKTYKGLSNWTQYEYCEICDEKRFDK